MWLCDLRVQVDCGKAAPIACASLESKRSSNAMQIQKRIESHCHSQFPGSRDVDCSHSVTQPEACNLLWFLVFAIGAGSSPTILRKPFSRPVGSHVVVIMRERETKSASVSSHTQHTECTHKRAKNGSNPRRTHTRTHKRVLV